MKSAELQIDLDAILYNVRHLKCYYQKNVIAVLKDNAYGLGLLPIAKALQYEDNIVFALSDFNEIKLLRENNINNRIIYLNVFDENDLEIINKYNIDVIVQSIKQYEIIKNKNIPFHVKVNTGMNRLGLCQKDFSKIVKNIKNDNNLTGIMTHFANDDVVIASNNGRMIRFNENEIRVMGRNASGVKGIELSDECYCVGAEIAKEGQEVLVVTEKGYGKRTDINEYRLTHRGSKGVKTLNITDKNGTIVAFKTVTDNKDLMIITDQGIIIRISLDKVSKMSRVTQGVRLMNLREGQKVATVSIVEKDEDSSEFNETDNVKEEA